MSVPRSSTRNRLLQLIPRNELASLLSISEEVPIQPRQILHHWRLPMDHVYFIEQGLVSVSARIGENRFVEAWLIGSEGMIGAPLLLTEEENASPPSGSAGRRDSKADIRS